MDDRRSATVTKNDLRGLRKRLETNADRFAAGVVIYDGEHTAGLGENLYAVPVGAVWETVPSS